MQTEREEVSGGGLQEGESLWMGQTVKAGPSREPAGSRQRPVGVGKQPESQPGLAGGEGTTMP